MNPNFIKAQGEDKQEIIMIRVIIRIDTDQIVEIGECHLEIELSMYRIIEEGHNMLRIIEMTLEEEISEECRITEVRILEVYIEVTIEMTIMEEVEVSLGKDNNQVILEGMIEVVVVGQDQVQEPVLTEIGLDVLNVGNMIISVMTVRTWIQKKSQKMYNKCSI